MFSIQGIDDIYFEKTKAYFQEVLSSFFNDNYRSSIVLLYSVVICDICLKLRELESVYNDGEARSILSTIQSMQNNESKSEWEKKLIDLVYEKRYINAKLKSDIAHLYSDRCFSAHPSMNEDFSLVSPSKETSIAHIKNMLDGLFVEPPTFNKSMINEITDDLERRKNAFTDDAHIEQYLTSSYFSRMTDYAKISLFKSLWCFCFSKPDDDNCKNNAEINRKAIAFLVAKSPFLLQKVKENGFLFSVSNEEWCLSNLCIFLSMVDAYEFVNQNDKMLVSNHVSKHSDYVSMSWYLYDNFMEYKNIIFEKAKRNQLFDLEQSTIFRIKEKFDNEGYSSDFFDLCIVLFGGVNDYYKTVSFYNKYIRPFIIMFNKQQLEELLSTIDSNRCIYNCFDFDAFELYKVYKNQTGKNPNFKKYTHLKRNPEFISAEDDSKGQ